MPGTMPRCTSSCGSGVPSSPSAERLFEQDHTGEVRIRFRRREQQ
jgi:hypothetical protein